MRLADELSAWLGRVEVVLAGGEDALREAEIALAAGDAMRARSAAHRVLGRAPGSPLGLALLADACELAGLDAERLLALEELSAALPTRAEVWLRLARARQAAVKTTAPDAAPPDSPTDALERALALADPGSDVRRQALLALADESLGRGAPERALLWLGRLPPRGDADAAVLRAQAHLGLGDANAALGALDGIEASATDGRRALVEGRARWALGQEAGISLLVRAFVLDEPGAAEPLAAALGQGSLAPEMRERARSVVEAKGAGGSVAFRAAFARAEGQGAEALRALLESVRGGNGDAVQPLLDAALELRDRAALREALAAAPLAVRKTPLAVEVHRFLQSFDVAPTEALRILAPLTEARLAPWANEALATAARTLVPELPAPADWSTLLPALDREARSLGALDEVATLAELAASRGRILRVAVVGEFNAGKSTFLNALIGEEVAPMSVVPLTATLHHLRYGPEAFARIILPLGATPSEQVVSTKRLREALDALGPAARRVELMLPLPVLTRIELLDTPGFNAPDTSHTTRARDAFAEADFALWLLDGSQALKESERAILAEARDAGLPVQILLNKADRLSPPDLAHVLATVTTALAEARLASHRPPIAFSARLALKGRLGDADALARSGFHAVETLLDDAIVAQADDLKERSLRRRLAPVVASLARRAAEGAGEEESLAAHNRARALASSAAAARLEAGADEATRSLADRLRPRLSSWRRELAPLRGEGRRRPLGLGSSPTAGPVDRALLRHGQARALALLEEPTLTHVAALAGNEAELAGFEAVVRSDLRLFAVGVLLGSDEDALLDAFAAAVVGALAEHLARQAEASAFAPTHERGRTRALGALAEALA